MRDVTAFTILTGGERLTTPMIRQEGGLVPTDWEIALQAVFRGLARPAAGRYSLRQKHQ